jgi:hypothetical protein
MATKTRVRKYRLLNGTHSEPKLDPKTQMGPQFGKEFTVYKKGDVIESERDLVADFPNKFELVRRPEADDGNPDGRPNGEDVTEFFKAAEGSRFEVFKSGKNYVVIDKAKPAEPVNLKPLTSKVEVSAFLRELAA